MPIWQRRTYRHAEKSTGYSDKAIWNSVQRDDLKTRCSGFNSALIEANKKERMKFCLSFIDPETRQFDGMYDRIHVDEKWFFLKEGKLNAIVAPDEDIGSRHAQSKRYSTKVMFLCAVARPRFDKAGNVLFDGNIGFWGFTEEAEAQHSSKNRPRGTIEMKPVNMDRVEYRDMLMENVFPAIKAKCPSRRKPVDVQQDGAPAHVKESDMEIIFNGTKHG